MIVLNSRQLKRRLLRLPSRCAWPSCTRAKVNTKLLHNGAPVHLMPFSRSPDSDLAPLRSAIFLAHSHQIRFKTHKPQMRAASFKRLYPK